MNENSRRQTDKSRQMDPLEVTDSVDVASLLILGRERMPRPLLLAFINFPSEATGQHEWQRGENSTRTPLTDRLERLSKTPAGAGRALEMRDGRRAGFYTKWLGQEWRSWGKKGQTERCSRRRGKWKTMVGAKRGPPLDGGLKWTLNDGVSSFSCGERQFSRTPAAVCLLKMLPLN